MKKKIIEKLKKIIKEENINENNISLIIEKSSEFSRLLDELFENKDEITVDKLNTLKDFDNTISLVIDKYIDIKNISVIDTEEIRIITDNEIVAMFNGNSSSSFNIYMKEASLYPLYTKEEEVDIFTRYKNGEEELKNEIVQHNLRLVISIAKRYMNATPYLSIMDLIQEGNIGLIVAVDKFDVTKGYKFSTCASWWIRQAITRALAVNGKMIRVPVHVNDKIYKYRKTISKFEAEYNRLPSKDEIMKLAKLNENDYKNIIRAIEVQPTSLDVPIGEEEHGRQSLLRDFVIDEENFTEEKAINSCLKKELIDIVNTLPEKDGEVIEKRFGLETDYTKTLEEVGNEYNLTRERIRQIEKRAKEKLKIRAKNKGLQDYL